MARRRKRAARGAASPRRPAARRAPAVRRRAPAPKRKATSKRKAAAPRRRSVEPSEAELRLLALAREVEGLAGEARPRAIQVVAAAYAEDGALPKAVHRAWLASRGDKTAALALAWAREQLRLGLQEAIAATPPPSGRALLPLPAETLAWLVLAACEALIYEPPSAAPDRLRLLLELTGHAAPPA